MSFGSDTTESPLDSSGNKIKTPLGNYLPEFCPEFANAPDRFAALHTKIENLCELVHGMRGYENRLYYQDREIQLLKNRLHVIENNGYS